METENKPLVAESVHWYDRAGGPVYEVPRAKGDGMRPTTLADARKLDLLPSVTMILKCAAAPGLEAWKARQVLEAALTLPKRDDETLDDYATRVIEDSKAQGKKAAEKGTELHAAIEDYIRGQSNLLWDRHLTKLVMTLNQYGIDIFKGKPEHSFASPLGYGGKIDWHNDEIVCDFKTRKEINNAKRLAYSEHVMQLAAYANGLLIPKARCMNVFIGIDDCEVRIVEHSPEDQEKALKMFELLLGFWKLSKDF